MQPDQAASKPSRIEAASALEPRHELVEQAEEPTLINLRRRTDLALWDALWDKSEMPAGPMLDDTIPPPSLKKVEVTSSGEPHGFDPLGETRGESSPLGTGVQRGQDDPPTASNGPVVALIEAVSTLVGSNAPREPAGYTKRAKMISQAEQEQDKTSNPKDWQLFGMPGEWFIALCFLAVIIMLALTWFCCASFKNKNIAHDREAEAMWAMQQQQQAMAYQGMDPYGQPYAGY